MFKSKRDVDRHVNYVFNKIRDAKERNAKGYHFAKLYYDVADYKSGKRYLQDYLNIREAVPQAHKLMGQICEALQEKGKALESYKRSLDLDPEQNELILKVCELYCDPAVQVNPDNAKLWIEKAEKFFPGHYTVFKLKERVIDKDSAGDTGELENLINTELLKNPEDVKLHIRLLKLYNQSGMVDRAYEHAVKTEKKLPFLGNMDWYECIVDIYQVYEDQHGCRDNAVFYSNKLFALCTLTSLRLQTDDRDLLSVVKSLNQFDYDLNDVQAIRKQSTEWESFLTEMKGQFFFLVGMLLLKRALKGQLSWKDASSFSAVCFLLSDSLPTIDQKTSWFCQLSQDRRKLYDHLQKLGCDRLSQGGHMVYSLLSKQDGGQGARKLRQKVCTAQGLETLYKIIFTDGNVKKNQDDSYLLNNKIFTETSLDVPAKSQLLKYDSVAHILHRDNLNHLVWLALKYHSFKDEVQEDYEQLFGQQLFPNMKFGMMDLSGGDSGTLCQLDIQVFLYVTVRWVAMQQREAKRNLHPIADKPDLLPVCLSNNLCTKQQTDWWSAMFRLQTNTANEKLGKLFGVLTRGLETLRLVTPQAMPLSLIVHVARTLDRRAEEMESFDTDGLVSPRLKAVQHRSAFYWKAADEMLDRMERNSNVKMPKEMLFPMAPAMSDMGQVKDLREHIKFAMACVAMREERYEEALKEFERLPQAKAAYYTGIVYRKLCESLDTNANSTGGATNSQQMALLSNSKNALYKALDRLEVENNEELKEKVKEDLEGVVCKLISVESGGNLMDSLISNTSQTYSTAESDVSSDGEPVKQVKTPILNTPSKIYNQVMPQASPTRIDVQFRALEASNTAFSSRLNTLEETVRMNEKLIQELFTQLRECRDENRTLRDQVQILSFQGLSNMNMSMHRQSMGPSFPGTPQQRNMLNVMNNSFGAVPPTFDYQIPSAIPPHLSQYGYSAGSPRPGSNYGEQNFEDDLNHIDGEYYDPDAEAECYIPDQNLVQEWPFGQKAGVEGKHTITYSPQHTGKGAGQPPNPGMYVNALKGQSIQYGAYQQQPGGFPAQVAHPMPGPGFFTQNPQPVPAQPAPQAQSGVYPPQGQLGVMMNPATGLPQSMSPSFPANVQGAALIRPPTSSMMPPNAVMSSTTEAKPVLIPGSVGVPPPKAQTAPGPTVLVPVPGADQKGKTPQSAVGTNAGTFNQSTPGTVGQAHFSTVTVASSLFGQTTPGSAATMLSQLAAKQQPQVSPVAAPSTPQKTVFNGFSFTSTPKISEPKPDAEKENKAQSTASTAPKPFTGFSFSPPKAPASTTAASSAPPSSTGTTAFMGSPQGKTGLGGSTLPSSQSSTPQGQAGKGFIFGKNASPASFGALAASATTASAFKVTGDSSVFGGSAMPVFGKSPSPRRRDPSAGSDDHVDEYEPNVDFKPVVPLPDLIQVKTGEEDEEKLFSDRAKLFRFDMESKQWKERGIGELKILKHKQKVQYRVLMRREQVLKLCANHVISKEMKLVPMASSDKAWVWHAADFSEDTVKHEKFAAKFKDADRAAKFKAVFEVCQEDLKKAKTTETDVKKSEPVGATGKVAAENPSQGQQKNLTEMFKPKAGAWMCNSCYVQNGGEIIKCPCCGIIKPGATPEEIKAASAPATMSGSQPGLGGFKFGAHASQATSSPASGFMFGTGGVTPSTIQQTSDSATSKPVDLSGKDTSAPSQGQQNLTEMFKPKAGAWTCNGCYVQNGGEIIKCPCCGITKPGATAEEIKAASAPSIQPGIGGFKFGTAPSQGTSSPASGFKFGFGGSTPTASPAPPAQSGSLFGAAVPKPQSSGGFSFGVQPSAPIAQAASTEASSAGFAVKKDDTKYTFGAPASVTTTPSKAKDEVSAENSLLAKYLACPESWNCYMCETKLEGLTDMCPKCKVTREESLTKTPASQGEPTPKPFSFAPTGNSIFSVGKPASGQDGAKGFSFGANSSSSAVSSTDPSEGFKFTFPPAGTQKAQPPAAVGSGFNFSLSVDKPASAVTPVKSTAPMSTIKSPTSPEVTEDGFYVNKDGDDSHIHFEPVVPLPDKIEVKLGEEDEEVVFTHRAKLYRFDKGEWKERGLGVVKVLFHPENKKARILMRRDAILKICCNHYITEEIKFKPMPNSNGRALVWFAMDFSEDEPKTEQFSIKFKDEEAVSKFEAAIQDVKDRVAGRGIQSSDSKLPSTIVETVGAKTSTVVSKDSDTSQATENDVVVVKVETASMEQIQRARELQLPDHFFLYELRPPCMGCRGCDDDDWTYEGEVEEFNQGNDEDDEDYETEDEDDDDDDEDDDDEDEDQGSEEEDTDFLFGKKTDSSFSFASLAKTSDPIKPFSADSNKPFAWEGAGKQLFGAGASGGGGGGDSDGEGDDVQQGEDPHFEPVVALPELIEVKTGEEDETAVFSQRSKLYRFDKSANQWKEKGIGEFKLLKHKETGKYRLLLRREQVHKLACNHLLTPDLTFKPLPTSETSWCWTAQDFSEPEGRVEQFALKFKNIDIAKTFKAKIDEIQKELSQS